MSTGTLLAPGPARPQAAFSSNRIQPHQQFVRQRACQIGRKQSVCTCAQREAAQGFGKSSKKNKAKSDGNWINIARMSEFPADRPTKPIVLKDKSVVMLYNIDGEVYCSDANSTAYKYPLTHAKIVEGKSGPAVEVPLDGTIYDLGTGDVLEWCPKNNLIRKFLGAIKSNQRPEKLKVYPTQVDDEGTIAVRFYNPSAAKP